MIRRPRRSIDAAAYEQIRNRYPEGSYVADAKFGLANCLYNQGDDEGAITPHEADPDDGPLAIRDGHHGGEGAAAPFHHHLLDCCLLLFSVRCSAASKLNRHPPMKHAYVFCVGFPLPSLKRLRSAA